MCVPNQQTTKPAAIWNPFFSCWFCKGKTMEEAKPIAAEVQREGKIQSSPLPLNTNNNPLMDTQKSSEAKPVVTIDVHQAKGLTTSGHRYLDVRTEEEFKKGHPHVENAVCIPYMFNTPQGRVKNPEFLEKVSSSFSKDDHLVVGCQSGVRSLYASAELLSIDFKHVVNMGGGYAAWLEKGLPVKKPGVSTFQSETYVKTPGFTFQSGACKKKTSKDMSCEL